jgi:hypothetical protein
MKNDNRCYEDLSGKRFGKRVAYWPVGRISTSARSTRILWLCLCDCGILQTISSGSLRSGKARSCKKCRRTVSLWKRYIPENQMFAAAKCRAKRLNLSFDIEISDICIPAICPLLNIPLISGINKKLGNSPNSPSLDRKTPSLGYVKGNIWVLSRRANLLKNDATIEEMECLLNNWKRLI